MSLRFNILKRRYDLRRRRSHYGVFLSPESQTLTVRTGERARFTFFVENDSEKPVTLRAEVQGLTLGWLATLTRSDPHIPADEAFWLAPEERAHYLLILRPPRQLQTGVGQAQLTVIDVENASMTASAVAIVEVKAALPETSE